MIPARLDGSAIAREGADMIIGPGLMRSGGYGFDIRIAAKGVAFQVEVERFKRTVLFVS